MGKKRRILTRATKFAKKYFEFLDRADGNAADDELEGSTVFIDSIALTDLKNQTLKITGRVLGDVTAMADQKVQYSLDGGANFTDSGAISRDGGDGGLDEFTFTINNALNNSAAATPGLNTVLVRPKGTTNEDQSSKSKTIAVETAKVDLSALTAVEGDGTNGAADGEVAFGASAAIDLAAAAAGADATGRLANELSFSLGNQGAGKNSFVITMVDADGDAVAFGANNTKYALSDAGQTVTTIAADPNGAAYALKPATSFSTAGAKNPHVLTITPRTTAGTAVTADAVTISVPIA